ncbi:MAG TPA: DsbE family thiol:disulfide interchange protein [Caulobacteraceae bacterium]|jgi:cytochrome c biogenesis protein CcmG/thiol:disulfide interchange protein DsbE|nr:DsbE family thiol:disulfide interchange protein [Caulobacteraceae bacterium]
MRRFLFLLPVIAFMLVAAAFMAGLGRDPSRLPSTLIGKRLPAFNLPPVRGDVGLKTQDLAGQPMLLNVFASWCVSCRVEHPVLLQLKAEGVNVEGLDWKDEAADGARYLAENGDPYALVGNDRTGRAGIDLGVAGVPETFVIDRKGRVRYKQIGPIAPEDWARTIKPLMDRLRAES